MTFKPAGGGVSRYFMLGTIATEDCGFGHTLTDLRRELCFFGFEGRAFHATSDRQAVRDRVFPILADSGVRFDVTIFEKRNALPHLQQNPARFYQTAWYQHLKFVAPRVVGRDDELLVVASELQIERKKRQILDAIHDVVRQVGVAARAEAIFVAASSDPCLQAADYLSWAVQRKHESGDDRSYNQIAHLIQSEFFPFRNGTPQY